MWKSGVTPKLRLAIAMLLSLFFASLLEIDSGAVEPFRNVIFILLFSSVCFLAYEALHLIFQKKSLGQKNMVGAWASGSLAKYELLILLLLTAIFASFLAIDHGIIGRMRTINMIMLCFSAAFTIKTAWKIVRKNR